MQRRQTATGLHVGLVAENGDGNFLFVADFLHVKGDGGVVDRGVTGRRPVLQVEDEVAVRVGEGPGEGNLDGLAIDLERDDLVVVRVARVILADEISPGRRG